jgi:hypothetical protein
LQKESDERFEAKLVGKTPLEQLKILSQKMAERNKVMKMREYYHHQIYVSIDMDKVVYSFLKFESGHKTQMPHTECP